MGFLFESGWLSLLCEYLIKSSVILSVSIVLVFLLRKKSAGLRHLVLSVFLIGLLFLPFLSSVTTGWETKFLPSWKTRDVATLKADGLIGNVNSSSQTLGSTSMASEAPMQMAEVKKGSRSVLSLFLSRSKPVFGFAALLLWFFGLLFLAFRIVSGLYGTIRLTREGQNIQDSLWKRLLYRFLQTVSLRRKINLLSHDQTMIPLTWGVFKPVVMMPAESRYWSENQRSSALYHELSHIKRGDFLVMIMARISRAIYWFNPLSWIVLGMIKREQEKACDELVLKAGIKPSIYAENLLFIRNSVSGHWNPPAAVLGAMNKSHLNDRLTTILKQRFNLKEVQMKTKVLLGVLAILSISFIGLARPGNSSDSHAEGVSFADKTVIEPVASYEALADLQNQDKKEQKKEVKKKAKKEDKKKEKTAVVWTTKEGKKGTYEIIYVISPHVKHDKDKYVTLTIKADKLHLSEDVKKIELDEGAVIYINKDDKEGVKVIELKSPSILVKKIHALPHVEVHPKVHVFVDTEKYEKLIEKIKEKLSKLKEKELDVEVKEVELEGIEKILEELKKALEKKFEKSRHYDVRIRTKDIHLDHEEGYHAVKITDDKGAFSLIYHAELDSDKKEAYEKAIKKLESNLPEGYDVETTFDEDEGTLLIKITKDKEAVEYKEAVESIDTLKKLIHEFQEELGKIKK